MKVGAILATVALILVGCVALRQVLGPRDSGVVYVSAEDEEMNAAIEQAQDTLGDFIEKLESPAPGQIGFSVKARFAFGSPGSYEHIWLDDVSYSGDGFSGTIANVPVDVKDLKYGDRVTVPAGDITDWMIVEDDKLVGGYTIRVMLKRMSAQEREEFLQACGFVVED
jgi:uncharacterized protein YegJ (DUF2314 family)